ncbi:chromosome segregation ATPase [Herbaspirillum sp. Sphag1AN]|uniref:ATP-binding protein n=1 Tax=unclassified Herbaspirillum TaxID=2624150 RepID=UPI001618C622|nr:MULTISPECIES: ATP-binding protein [unclassified Herbaspirillum]MBB3214432.1 chromosome segregation ATPase [Herbaspirillum sp. Sphag1AN]MBB3247464.1 chromosome segregation ATPase [Herbaspirillum sp. Sphag64]
MFHIKSLELVHWDYWQRVKNIPLDAKIITIAGQNGSGKTTLLDALRTLFGLDCSMKRSYKDYARHSGQQTVWLRAVVDNKTSGKQLSNRPFRSSGFFSEDEVTLFCQIQKNGGDWKRQYLILGGAVQIEEVGDNPEWLGLDNYRKRLANAGLSQAMSKVLALEQGETDKLCEYSPRQLLDLVFQVFGDKEVLDAYDEAKRHQRDTEQELQRFETELQASETHLAGLKLRVANYHQWQHLNQQRRDLQEEVLPSLQFHEARQKAQVISERLRDERLRVTSNDGQISTRRRELSTLSEQLTAARQREQALEVEQGTLGTQLNGVNALLKPLESLLSQKTRLQDLAGKAGADISSVTTELEQKEQALARERSAREAIKTRLAEERATITALESKKGLPEPADVTAMRRALLEAGIGHAMLTDVVEVKDAQWQAAVEGVLRGYTALVLLEDPSQAKAAFRLAEKLRYPHFIVPDLVKAPKVKDQSLLSVLDFSGAVPVWLIDQLKRINRVDSIEDGMAQSAHDEWITPEAYHRERRGGRSLQIDISRYRFGQAGRAQRLAALQRNLPALEAQEDQLTLKINTLAKEIGQLKSLIAGVDAAKELVARQAEFDEAEQEAAPLLASRQQVGARLGDVMAQIKPAIEERTLAETRWTNAKHGLANAESELRGSRSKLFEERAAHMTTLLSLRKQWRHLPFAWRRAERQQALAEQYQNAYQVNLRIDSLNGDLAREDWETDDTVVEQHLRLGAQLAGRQAETAERRYQNNRAIEATTNARAAYMERLRFTIKTYSRNIKELGELAGIEVHTDPVRLENDDLQLAQAGLHVRFKFDGKIAIGMNDGEASGGQQVMKSLILLIGLLKSDDGAGGFVFIDEPFAHLDIRNIQLVGEFLKNTDAQYLMTTPLTHNTDVYDPSELTLITSKKKRDTPWAPPIFVLQRQQQQAEEESGKRTRQSKRA